MPRRTGGGRRKRTRLPRRFRLRRMRARVGRSQVTVHNFKRLVNLGTYTASYSPGTGPIPIRQGFSFNMNLLPNVAEYSSLYDQYRLKGIQFRMVPKTSGQFQGATSGVANALGYGQVMTVIDYDDAATPVTKDGLMEFSTVKYTRSNAIHKRYLKPQMLTRLWVNTTTEANSPGPAKWVDWTYPNVEHYGIKLYVDAPVVNNLATDNSSISYDIYATFYFACKNTR